MTVWRDKHQRTRHIDGRLEDAGRCGFILAAEVLELGGLVSPPNADAFGTVPSALFLNVGRGPASGRPPNPPG